MTQLLVKDASFNFSKECIQAFDKLKHELMQASIMIKPDWSLPFKFMCDASDYAVGDVLGQRIDKHFKPIHYASKMMNEAQENYTTVEKELLAVIFAFDKFRQYLVLSKTIVFTDHSALRSDHLSRIENSNLGKLTKAEIRDFFLEEQLMTVPDKNNEPCVLTESYDGASLEMRQHKSYDNVIAAHQEGIMVSLLQRETSLNPGSTIQISFATHVVELYDEDGNEFIVNKQWVKPYQKDVLEADKNDDITLDEKGEVT
uniref:Reverse transcriptase domain-containing protein n=1 Tax=Tanacetum cinerariifolium TaxID=118510 RepID=A0A6L2MF40_TANCI|nr:reverse transcriptase domain-containing protein [Tanacetum cinerariifolium]GFA49920.1 reverse transcriptase domain-containing protein [Tanacetum cinerariifolium]